jgi:hypothetical protein
MTTTAEVQEETCSRIEVARSRLAWWWHFFVIRVPSGNTHLGGNAMGKSIMAATLAPLFVAAVAVQGAGQAQNPPTQTPQTKQPTTTAQQPTTTLAGCLYREDQVPGRKPNVAERAGVLEDYILADASMAGTQAKPGATTGATGTTGTVSSSGNLYKVEGPSDEKLKALVGKRVEVTGRIDPQGGATPGKPTPDRGPGPDEIILPEFEATSIREVSGTCPATPAPRK